jgi:hypothetical protein
LPWCLDSFLGEASDVTTLERSVAEAVFPACLPRNSSTLACTSTVLGGASDDDDAEDVVLVFVLVFMVAVFVADALLASGAIEDGTSTLKSSSGAFVLVLFVLFVLLAVEAVEAAVAVVVLLG